MIKYLAGVVSGVALSCVGLIVWLLHEDKRAEDDNVKIVELAQQLRAASAEPSEPAESQNDTEN